MRESFSNLLARLWPRGETFDHSGEEAGTPPQCSRLFKTLALLLVAAGLGGLPARGQSLSTEGNALISRIYNSDSGPTNSQLTFDFAVTQGGVLGNILTWGESSGQNLSGIGQSFEVFVLRPLNTTNFQVVFGTPYFTVTNTGTNIFPVSGVPFLLLPNDVIAHYGRGIPFDNGTGGPSSVYVNTTVPVPVVGTTITVPSSTYPLYSDGGRAYSIQIQAEAAFLVTTNSDGGPGSLRQAVSSAAALGGGVIYFTNTLAGQTIYLTNGVITLSQSITIDASALPGGMRIDGSYASGIFSIPGSPTVKLNGLTLTNGYSTTGGGAIYNNAGILILNNCTVAGNTAEGVFGSGGGIDAVGGSLSLSNCTFAGNTVISPPLYINAGGAIDAGGSTVITGCAFYSNSIPSGVGGALFGFYSGSVWVTNCTFTANSAAYGGAYATQEAPAIFSDTTIFGNTATEAGGGIDNDSTTTLINCIVAGNSAPAGMGVDIYNEYQLTNGGGNLIGNNDQVSNTFSAGPLVGTEASPLNPQLAPLGTYGGPTLTMPPLPGSPAIDAGTNSVTNVLATDQRGSARKVGAAVDIGAVESGGLWVANTSDSGAGSLRYVLTNAAATVASPKIINFLPSLSGGTVNLASQLLVSDTNGVTLDASALPDGVGISGDTVTRVFNVTNGAVATFNSLTIENGTAPDANFAAGGGGAGLLCSGRAVLFNCSVVNNFVAATFNFVGYAAGLGCNGGYLALTNCTVAGNQIFGAVGSGAAAYNYGGTLILDHCTVADNTGSVCAGIVANYGMTVLHATALANGNIDFSNILGGISMGNNYLSDGTASYLHNGVNGDQIGAGDPSQALLAEIGYYGGRTPIMPPLPGSPLIDAGGIPDTATDQRGFPRLAGLAADVGAVEGVLLSGNLGKVTSVAALPGGPIQLTFTNQTDALISVWAGTNAAQPIGTWTPLGYATESPAGYYHFIDSQAGTGFPQRYYILAAPE